MELNHPQFELNHTDAAGLFGPLVDEELSVGDSERLRAHLDGCGPCQQQWTRYSRTVLRVRSVERERAPASLASQLARRMRRGSFRARSLRSHWNHQVPAEGTILLVLAAGAAAVLFHLYR